MGKERLIGLARRGLQRTNEFLKSKSFGNSLGRGGIIASSAMLGLSIPDRSTEMIVINASIFIVSIVETINMGALNKEKRE